ncbi:MAG: cell division protein ZapD [Gammaproteobacteria bacterium]
MTERSHTAVQNSLFPQTAADVFYEQPLGERIRTFLRLEHLFAVVAAYAADGSDGNSRVAIAGLIDITDILSRSDLKAELMKELDRQAAVLAAFKRNPKVDMRRLEEELSRLDGVMSRLRAPDYQPGQTLRRDELVAAIRQRISIPGGTCNFDLPGFHYWLSLPAQARIDQLARWTSDLRALREAVDLALTSIRLSASPTQEVARGGFYQQALDPNATCHLVRVGLPSGAPYFPEISAGKHRFTIRFLEQSNTQVRPAQTAADVDFLLERCIL